MTSHLRNKFYVINIAILIGVAFLVATSGKLYSSSTSEASAEESKHYYGPGDNKQGYDSIDYKTNALDLQKRIGKKANLLDFVSNPPLGLPPVPVPADNPITEEKVNLGRRLFFDRRLSINDTFSCAICHIPEQGFTNNEIQTAVGVEGRSGKRNAPMIYNVAYLELIFHDGRESTLEQQVWAPFLARNE
ncbi:MAG: cytochrome-c peroxidase, partial [Gammaproteobacteria bacterium]